MRNRTQQNSSIIRPRYTYPLNRLPQFPPLPPAWPSHRAILSTTRPHPPRRRPLIFLVRSLEDCKPHKKPLPTWRKLHVWLSSILRGTTITQPCFTLFRQARLIASTCSLGCMDGLVDCSQRQRQGRVTSQVERRDHRRLHRPSAPGSSLP